MSQKRRARRAGHRLLDVQGRKLPLKKPQLATVLGYSSKNGAWRGIYIRSFSEKNQTFDVVNVLEDKESHVELTQEVRVVEAATMESYIEASMKFEGWGENYLQINEYKGKKFGLPIRHIVDQDVSYDFIRKCEPIKDLEFDLKQDVVKVPSRSIIKIHFLPVKPKK